MYLAVILRRVDTLSSFRFVRLQTRSTNRTVGKVTVQLYIIHQRGAAVPLGVASESPVGVVECHFIFETSACSPPQQLYTSRGSRSHPVVISACGSNHLHPQMRSVFIVGERCPGDRRGHRTKAPPDISPARG